MRRRKKLFQLIAYFRHFWACLGFRLLGNNKEEMVQPPHFVHKFCEIFRCEFKKNSWGSKNPKNHQKQVIFGIFWSKMAIFDRFILTLSGPLCTGEFCLKLVNNCENNCNEIGTQFCENGVNSYDCDCKLGFIGRHCEIDINECVSQPCKNRPKTL